MPQIIDAEHRIIESARRPKGWSKMDRPRKHKGDVRPPCPPELLDDAPMPFSASYDADDIRALVVEARNSYHKKSKSFHATLRRVCEQRGYNYQSFRRWLYRNGIRAYSNPVDLLRRRQIHAGGTQIIITLLKEENDRVRQAEEILNVQKRTTFARAVLMKAVDEIIKKAKQ